MLSLLVEAARTSFIRQDLGIEAPITEATDNRVCVTISFVDYLRKLEPWDYVLVFVVGLLFGPVLDLVYLGRKTIAKAVDAYFRPPYRRIA